MIGPATYEAVREPLQGGAPRALLAQGTVGVGADVQGPRPARRKRRWIARRPPRGRARIPPSSSVPAVRVAGFAPVRRCGARDRRNAGRAPCRLERSRAPGRPRRSAAPTAGGAGRALEERPREVAGGTSLASSAVRAGRPDRPSTKRFAPRASARASRTGDPAGGRPVGEELAEAGRAVLVHLRGSFDDLFIALAGRLGDRRRRAASRRGARRLDATRPPTGQPRCGSRRGSVREPPAATWPRRRAALRRRRRGDGRDRFRSASRNGAWARRPPRPARA